jgi:hypothetical protein
MSSTTSALIMMIGAIRVGGNLNRPDDYSVDVSSFVGCLILKRKKLGNLR